MADIDIVDPLNSYPYFSSVSVLKSTLLEVKQIGVKIPNRTGIQVGNNSPSLTIFGASDGA